MRAFIGIEFSNDIKKQLVELQNNIRKEAVKGRWKVVENFHLTLKFLGEIDEVQLKNIDTCIQNIRYKYNNFSLYINSLGMFSGKDNSIRVLWLGMDGDINKLNNIQSDIDNSLVGIGFEKEKRKYQPHITIGQDIILKNTFNEIKDNTKLDHLDKINVSSIQIFKSEQIGPKRVYTVIKEYQLK